MTEYQKIEKELLSLGWRKEHGSGDHIKFIKDDNPTKIVVSISVSTEGRALKNTYAQIRRIEPRFSLGRQKHMLEGYGELDEGQGPIQAPPEGVPEWMRIGSFVRWTGPEGRDWSLLDDPCAAMSRQYKVVGYKETKNDGPMVVIQESGQEHKDDAFPVFPSMLDAWTVFACEGCGKKLPENLLYEGDDDKLYCNDCLGEKKDIHGADVATADEKPKKSLLEKMAENDEVLSRFLDALQLLKDKDLAAIKDEKDEKVNSSLSSLKYIYNNTLSAKARKAIRNEYPVLVSGLLDNKEASPEEGVAISEYSAWVGAVDTLARTLLFTDAAFREETYESARVRLFASLDYSVRPVKDRKIRRKNVAMVVSVSTKDDDLAISILGCSSLFLDFFQRALVGLPIVLFVSGKSVRQYSIGEHIEYLDILRNNLPNSEKDYLTRDGINAMLPPFKDVYEEVDRRIETFGTTPAPAIALNYDIHPDDRGHYMTARPIYRLFVGLNDDKQDSFDSFMKSLRESGPFSVPIIVNVVQFGGKRNGVVDLTAGYKYPEGMFLEDNDGDGIINLLSIDIDPADGGYDVSFTDDAKRQEMLVNALCTSAEKIDRLREIYGLALSSFREKVPGAGTGEAGTGTPLPHVTDNNQSENDSKMEKKDILERTNPGSSRPELGQYSTRELLRELKERGVEFDNLTIIVRESISLDEI